MPLRSVGQPPPGVRVWLRDSADGGASEIMVAGPNVSLGYWGETSRDASAPFATGDAGHIASTGNLYVHGRIREVIDVAGRKVAPWIVAEAVAQHPSVTECAVFGADDAIRGRRVAAAVVGSALIDHPALRAHCRARLEPHEVPRDWVFLDEIPLSSGGKPDLAALQRATSKAKTARKPD